MGGRRPPVAAVGVSRPIRQYGQTAPTTRHSPLATRHSPFATPHSLLATRYSLLPTPHSPSLSPDGYVLQIEGNAGGNRTAVGPGRRAERHAAQGLVDGRHQ